MNKLQKRIIVGITGASGVVMGYELLKILQNTSGIETHLILTKSAALTWQYECGIPLKELLDLADVVHKEGNMAASISSGSFHTDGMIVIPCSMKTLGGIASGYTDNLVLRAADVCLKENRRVVLVPREMPFGKVHLRNLGIVSDLGCSIIPPMLTFYNAPENLSDQIHHVLGKVLMQFGISSETFRPWEGVSE